MADRTNAPIPSLGGLGIIPADLTQADISLFMNALQVADRALRENPSYARKMLHDPEVIHAVNLRAYTVGQLEGSVEPEDPEDPVQVAQCAAIEKALERMRRFVQFKTHLARAFWDGTRGASLEYARRRRAIVGSARTVESDPDSETVEAEVSFVPREWMPFNGDSFRWTRDGEVMVRVRPGIADQPRDKLVPVFDGYARRLDPNERASLAVCVWNIEGPDYEDPTTVERAFAGHGLRSMLWWAWLAKQHTAKQGAHYMERLARGIVVVLYAMGSDEGKEAAQDLLKMMHSEFGFTVPTNADDLAKQPPFHIIEPTGTGYQIFKDHRELDAERIVKVILGQELVTGTASTGLGSGVAEAHETTFKRLIRYDAECVADAITHDIVGPMMRLNFPDADYEPRYIFQVDQEDADAKLERFAKASAMGVEFAEREVREIAGGREPEGDEPRTGGGGGDFAGIGDLSGAIGPSIGE